MKIESLSLSISQLLKLDNNTSRLIAHGLCDRLRMKCWDDLSDKLGDADDIDIICRWQHKQRWLAVYLEKCGFIERYRKENDIYRMINIVRDLPEYIRKRWRRFEPVEYEDAFARDKGRPYTIPQQKGRDKKPTKEGLLHKELMHYWDHLWSEKYGRNYPFKTSDARFIRELQAQAKEEAACKKTLVAFINDNDNFIAGRCHNLSSLISNLPRYLGRPAGPGRGHEGQYSGANSSIIL